MSTNEMSEIEVNARAASEGPAEPTPVVFIMGAGVVGTALAARLVRAGVPVAGLHGRQHDLSDAASAVSGVLASTGEIPPILSESDVVIISVRDERIPEVAERLVREKRLRKEQVLLHTSGAIAAAQALAVARSQVRAVGTLHPLVSFADARVAVEELRSVAFGIEGDEAAKAVAGRLVRSLGARAVFLDAENLPLYHVGAVIAANYVVALADVARGLLVKAGVPEAQALPALIPLLSSVVQNLSRVGLPGALTGPVERGDVSSVEQHLRILEARAPEVLDLYRLLGREVLRLAGEKSELEPAKVARLESLFRAPGAPSGTNGGRVPESAKEPTKESMKGAGKESGKQEGKQDGKKKR
jgi:predicted short-subunit dehydrogenase-like oxidoreductase (DUF2520 family)